METPRGHCRKKSIASTSSISPRSKTHAKGFSAFNMEDISKQMTGLNMEDGFANPYAANHHEIVAPTPRYPVTPYQTSYEATKQVRRCSLSCVAFCTLLIGGVLGHILLLNFTQFETQILSKFWWIAKQCGQCIAVHSKVQGPFRNFPRVHSKDSYQGLCSVYSSATDPSHPIQLST
jgi:hypothetical protein